MAPMALVPQPAGPCLPAHCPGCPQDPGLPWFKLECKAHGLAVLGRLGLTGQRKSCGKLPFAHSDYSPKGGSIGVSMVPSSNCTWWQWVGWVWVLCRSCSWPAPKAPHGECHEVQSWYPAGNSPLQGYTYPQLVFLSHCCRRSHSSFFHMSLLVALCLSAATDVLLCPTFLPLSLPCPLPASAATVALLMQGHHLPVLLLNWWDKDGCQTALLLVKNANSGSSMPIRQSWEPAWFNKARKQTSQNYLDLKHILEVISCLNLLCNYLYWVVSAHHCPFFWEFLSKLIMENE